jgi:hypothetical protein
MKADQEGQDLSRVEKRAIEALAVAPVVEAIARRIGWDDAMAILKEVNQQEAFSRGEALAEEIGRNGIEELVQEVAGWGRGGAWEMEVLEQTPKTYFFNVSRCPYYERYRDLGLQKLGVAFSCCRDEPFAKGLNTQLSLKRTSTLMEGGTHCDFRYYLEPSDSTG